MTKISYTATFSTGRVLTRKSEREYAAAYYWAGENHDGSSVGNWGFARTHKLAQQAIQRETSWLRAAPAKRSGPLAYVRHMAQVRANWKPGKVTFSEVVAVQCAPARARVEAVPNGTKDVEIAPRSE